MNAIARRENWKIIGGIALVLLLAWGIWYAIHRSNENKKADQDVATSVKVDSSHKAQTTASAKVDTVIRTILIHDKALTGTASNLKRASDTAGQGARTATDSSAMYRLRWQLVGMAYDTLSVAHTALLVVVDSLTTDRNRWHSVADSAVTTMDALRKDLAVARTGCRVLPFVPCLSRKETFIVGAVTGVVAYSRLHR